MFMNRSGGRRTFGKLGLSHSLSPSTDESHAIMLYLALDAHLSGCKWLVGDDFTLADFSVAAGLCYAVQAKLPLEKISAISGLGFSASKRCQPGKIARREWVDILRRAAAGSAVRSACCR